jgi:hypothetical protein
MTKSIIPKSAPSHVIKREFNTRGPLYCSISDGGELIDVTEERITQ